MVELELELPEFVAVLPAAEADPVAVAAAWVLPSFVFVEELSDWL
jgi:hypothetical protein